MISAGTLTDLHQDQLPFILYELPCQFSGIIFYSYSLHKRKQQRNEQSILPLLLPLFINDHIYHLIIT